MIPKKVPSKKQSDQWRLDKDKKATLAVHQRDMLSFFLKTLHIFKTEMVVRFAVLYCVFLNIRTLIHPVRGKLLVIFYRNTEYTVNFTWTLCSTLFLYIMLYIFCVLFYLIFIYFFKYFSHHISIAFSLVQL
jgi:hypothetical protein